MSGVLDSKTAIYVNGSPLSAGGIWTINSIVTTASPDYTASFDELVVVDCSVGGDSLPVHLPQMAVANYGKSIAILQLNLTSGGDFPVIIYAYAGQNIATSMSPGNTITLTNNFQWIILTSTPLGYWVQTG